MSIPRVAVTIFVLLVFLVALLYPFIVRNLIFYFIPQSWTLSSFKTAIFSASYVIAIVTAVGCAWSVKTKVHEIKWDQLERLLALIGILLFSILVPFFTFFYPQYINDRTWVSSSYKSMTQQEIELQPIGQVMEVDATMGFHYRALFLKVFQYSFIPIALILPLLFWAVKQFVSDKGITKNSILPLGLSLIMLAAYFILGLWLYG